MKFWNGKNLTRPPNAFGAPIRPRHLVPTQQGVGTLAPNDLTPCRMAFYFVSTFALVVLIVSATSIDSIFTAAFLK
jgi:hypothetical protein